MEDGNRIRQWIMWLFGAIAISFTVIFIYSGIQRDKDIDQCLRNTQDRISEAYGWRATQQRRILDGDLKSAAIYDEIARDLESRSGLGRAIDIDKDEFRDVVHGTEDSQRKFCENVYPGLIPFIAKTK
jgi:hypothetical protein